MNSGVLGGKNAFYTKAEIAVIIPIFHLNRLGLQTRLSHL